LWWNKDLTNKDWIILVLSFAGGVALTRIQIQKALFLIQHNLPKGVSARPDYDFVPACMARMHLK
jgi:hypothetical protein